ncbi:MAG: hypothetical protein ABI376_07305 [Caulobacteraceae bacterium]
MADRTFEMELDRMFGEAPAMADADVFTSRVLGRLDRGWNLRQLLIGGLGLAGGVIGGAQIVGSDVIGRLTALGAHSDRLVSARLDQLHVAGILPDGVLEALPVNGEALVMSAALAVLAVGFAVVRAVRDI